MIEWGNIRFKQLTRAGLPVKRRFKFRLREKKSLGVKNAFLGNK